MYRQDQFESSIFNLGVRFRRFPEQPKGGILLELRDWHWELAEEWIGWYHYRETGPWLDEANAAFRRLLLKKAEPGMIVTAPLYVTVEKRRVGGLVVWNGKAWYVYEGDTCPGCTAPLDEWMTGSHLCYFHMPPHGIANNSLTTLWAPLAYALQLGAYEKWWVDVVGTSAGLIPIIYVDGLELGVPHMDGMPLAKVIEKCVIVASSTAGRVIKNMRGPLDELPEDAWGIVPR